MSTKRRPRPFGCNYQEWSSITAGGPEKGPVSAVMSGNYTYHIDVTHRCRRHHRGNNHTPGLTCFFVFPLLANDLFIMFSERKRAHVSMFITRFARKQLISYRISTPSESILVVLTSRQSQIIAAHWIQNLSRGVPNAVPRVYLLCLCERTSAWKDSPPVKDLVSHIGVSIFLIMGWCRLSP